MISKYTAVAFLLCLLYSIGIWYGHSVLPCYDEPECDKYIIPFLILWIGGCISLSYFSYKWLK